VVLQFIAIGRGAFYMLRSYTERSGGAYRSEYAGISSDKRDENSLRRKSKVSWAMLVIPGLVGPKARPKGVVDGKQVIIPVPANNRYQLCGDVEG
jgi:hypothetical protein